MPLVCTTTSFVYIKMLSDPSVTFNAITTHIVMNSVLERQNNNKCSTDIR